jgi:hypothetical protein
MIEIHYKFLILHLHCIKITPFSLLDLYATLMPLNLETNGSLLADFPGNRNLIFLEPE